MGSKFKVGDRVRRVEPGDYFGITAAHALTVQEIEGSSVKTESVRHAGGGVWHFEDELAPATPAYTIEHVIPLIRDARQLAAAADTLANRGSDTKFVDNFIQELYAEIGEKVCASVEVDA